MLGLSGELHVPMTNQKAVFGNREKKRQRRTTHFFQMGAKRAKTVGTKTAEERNVLFCGNLLLWLGKTSTLD
jgi:hypothetical protein